MFGAIYNLAAKLPHWFLAGAGLCAVIILQIKFGGLQPITQDSLYYQEIASDIIAGRPPSLDVLAAAQGHHVLPYPLGYPLCLASLSCWNANLLITGTIATGILAIFLSCYALSKLFADRLLVTTSLFTGYGVWLYGHAWSEGLMLALLLSTIALAESKRRWAPVFAFATGMVRYLTAGAFGGLLLASILANKKSCYVYVLGSLSSVGGFVAIALYTRAAGGGDRALVTLSAQHFISVSYALMAQLGMLRPGGHLVWLLPQIVLWALLVRFYKPNNISNALILGGLGYLALIFTAQLLFDFAEPIDTRLAGPGLLLTLIGLTSGASGFIRVAHVEKAIYYAIVLSSLPLKGILKALLSLN